MEWFNMPYDEINKINDLSMKKQYLDKYRMGLVYFINPIYDSLTKKQKQEFDEFDKDYQVPMYYKIEKLKEIIGEDKAKQIVRKKINR